jgi:hypothetical protein
LTNTANSPPPGHKIFSTN